MIKAAGRKTCCSFFEGSPGFLLSYKIVFSAIIMTEGIPASTTVPQKPDPGAEPPASSALWRTILSLFAYIAVYYALFRDLLSVLLLVIVIIIHEGGHFLAMKTFGYRDVRLFFVPLIGAFVSGTSRFVRPYQKAIMILAGPLPGIFIGMIFFSVYMITRQHVFFQMALLFLLLNGFNLLPVNPLDGGQLLQTLYFGSNYTIQTVFILLSSIAIAFISFLTGNYFLLLILFFLLTRLRALLYMRSLRNNMIRQGADLSQPYESISNDEYLAIRKVLLKVFEDREGPAAAKEENDENEIGSVIQSLLQNNSTVPVSLYQKTYLTLLWLMGLLVPLLALVFYLTANR